MAKKAGDVAPSATETVNETITQSQDLMAEIQTVAVTPVVAPAPPRPMQIERQGVKSEPYVRHMPHVRGGICEFCGVLDPNVPSQYQYKLCPHFRGLSLRCSYCDENKDPDEVVYHADLQVVEHPDRPGTLIVCCDSYECSRAHQQRFQRSR